MYGGPGYCWATQQRNSNSIDPRAMEDLMMGHQPDMVSFTELAGLRLEECGTELQVKFGRTGMALSYRKLRGRGSALQG
jgi:hypothetical protein